MISPTGLGIRSDSSGDGRFGSARGIRTHKGIDFLTRPGQPLIMPVSFGELKRIVWPYKVNGDYRGVEISGYDQGFGGVTLKLMYMVPFQLKGGITQGSIIGWSQDVSKKHGGSMLPHVHLEVRQNGKLFDPEILIENWRS